MEQLHSLPAELGDDEREAGNVPLGRGRLGTKPDATGSPTIATTGTVLVACFTVSATIIPGAPITSTLLVIMSDTNLRKRPAGSVTVLGTILIPSW
jgi:hypothetical protein